MKNSMKMLSLLVLGGLVMLSACKKKHNEPTPLSLTALTVGTADLNGATAPTGVDPTLPITAAFTTNVDASTATSTNITLTRDYDQANIPVTISTAANVVTITPNDHLNNGALFVLAIGAGLKSTDGLAFAPVTRSFTTSGTFTPDGQISYWTFENNGNDVVGTNDAAPADVVDITYVDGRNAAAGKAASFNGTTSIIEVANGDQMLNAEFSIAFWMDLDSSALKADGVTQRGHFVMGVGNFNGLQLEVEDHERWVKWATMYKRVNGVSTDSAGLDNFYNGDATRIHGGGRDSAVTVMKTATAAQIQAMIGHQWNHVAYTFSAANKTASLYWNGTLVFQMDYNLFQTVADAGNKKFYGVVSQAFHDPGVAPGAADYYEKTWAFGFWESRASTFPSWGQSGYVYTDPDAAHFKGALDDVHLYHRALTSDEIGLMYNSEK